MRCRGRRSARPDRRGSPRASRHVGRGRDVAGADRPDRLVGDDQLAFLPVVRQRAGELALDHRRLVAGGAVDSLSPTQTMALRPGAAPPRPWRGRRDRSRAARRGARCGRGWPSAPGFLDHRRGDRAGMRAALRGMAVLGADGEAAARAGHRRRDQGEGRADGDVDAALGLGRLAISCSSPQLGDAAVHLPVADDELAADVHSGLPVSSTPHNRLFVPRGRHFFRSCGMDGPRRRLPPRGPFL